MMTIRSRAGEEMMSMGFCRTTNWMREQRVLKVAGWPSVAVDACNPST